MAKFCTLVNLRGRPGTTRALWVFSRTAALAGLRRHVAVTCAGDHGAMNVFRVGKLWRCEFYRRFCTQSSQDCATKREIREWLRVWWPKMHNS